MFAFNSVPSVCTARHITNWSFMDTSSMSPDKKAEYYLERLEVLKSTGGQSNHMFSDFALIYVIVTESQRVYCEEFLLEVGFQKVFRGRKSRNKKVQREQSSGDLHMYCIEPMDYAEGVTKMIEKYKKIKKESLKNEIDLRNRFEYLTAYALIKEGIFKGGEEGKAIGRRLRAKEQVNLTEALAEGITIDDLIIRVKNKFGVNLRDKKDQMSSWTVDRLKTEQQRWKDQYKNV